MPTLLDSHARVRAEFGVTPGDVAERLERARHQTAAVVRSLEEARLYARAMPGADTAELLARLERLSVKCREAEAEAQANHDALQNLLAMLSRGLRNRR